MILFMSSSVSMGKDEANAVPSMNTDSSSSLFSIMSGPNSLDFSEKKLELFLSFLYELRLDRSPSSVNRFLFPKNHDHLRNLKFFDRFFGSIADVDFRQNPDTWNEILQKKLSEKKLSGASSDPVSERFKSPSVRPQWPPPWQFFFIFF